MSELGVLVSGLSVDPNSSNKSGHRVAFLRLPFFTPMTPPLGLGLMKAFLESRGHRVTCHDFNVDSELWNIHHTYFAALNTYADQGSNDGYANLWCILNAHFQAKSSGADAAVCMSLTIRLCSLFSINIDHSVAYDLHALVERYFSRLDSILEKISAEGVADAEFLGVSTYTTSLASSLYALKKLKRRFPHIKTIIGGGIFADDFALGSENLATMERCHDFIDHIVLGEGELLIQKLIEGNFGAKRIISIADLGRENLDIGDVPMPNFTDFDMDSYSHLTIEGGRSCPFQCSFCSETIQWGSYRKKSKEVLAQQMQALSIRHGNNNFFMADSLINPYINGLSSELLSRNIDVMFDGYLRADKAVADRSKTETYAKAGLYRVRLGMESASTRMLEIMDKRTNPGTMSEVLQSLTSAGIRPTTYWVVGHPGETEADFEETVRFVKENHQSMYELEAHPYYYHPYGQVSSRLFEATSIYPDDIADVLKFQVWDVVGQIPERRERYSRLKRFSDVASSLGIPNIYSLADRFQAEERWLSLSPSAREVL